MLLQKWGRPYVIVKLCFKFIAKKYIDFSVYKAVIFVIALTISCFYLLCAFWLYK